MSAAEEGRSLGELVASATAELSALMHDEIALAKAELQAGAKKATVGGAAGVIGIFLAISAVPLLSFALAFWLNNWWGISLALSCTIVGGFYLVLAGLLFLLAKRKFGGVSKPERSMRSAKETAAVLSSVKPHPRPVPMDKAGSST
ncbi:phage holin family protein [Streptomyces sp. PT12]|uniref:phage holin family protein n=1 Tax=Streptomyces sp. PT12 TaxID=1510197 RepID=UPI000DE54220|nr:phage holin family protein [Streptomyces sp. PT12]RBM18932.1 phage holin family protein [Streptomyces sp. PT12]